MNEEQTEQMNEALRSFAKYLADMAEACRKAIQAIRDMVNAFFQSPVWQNLKKWFRLTFRTQQRHAPMSQARVAAALLRLPNSVVRMLLS